LLKNAGFDFDHHKLHGIDIEKFGELFMTCGLVTNEDINWITFHGMYDFAYLLRALSGDVLPSTMTEFCEHLKYFFPCTYDLKQIFSNSDMYKDMGLEKISSQFNLTRFGIMHQAGSDALLTAKLFLKMKHEMFGDDMSKIKSDYLNLIFNLNPSQETDYGSYYDEMEYVNMQQMYNNPMYYYYEQQNSGPIFGRPDLNNNPMNYSNPMYRRYYPYELYQSYPFQFK